MPEPTTLPGMARLRLFANLRESAGTSSVDIDGDTVGEVLDTAVDRFGSRFAAGLGAANVWVNGDGADRGTPVRAGDEIALIPPVSGGTAPAAETVRQDSNDATPALLGIVLLATFVIANIISAQALVFAAVGGALAWLWDIGETSIERGVATPVIPALIGATAAGNGAYAWGLPGFAFGIVVGLVAVVVWAVIDAHYRTIEGIAGAALMTLTASLGVGAIVLVRNESVVFVTTFLVVIAIGAVAAWAARRFLPDVAGIDPNLAAIVGVMLGSLGAGLLADTMSLLAALACGAAAVVGLFAGRAVGSMLRGGSVVHTTRSPGLLTALDSAILAAATFWLGVMFLA